MKLAVIPARGGSKRIPQKNIKPFCGKPIIAWSIEAARSSGCFDRIVVSTDDQNIVDIAVEHGADVPFLRPEELCDDHTPIAPVMAHAVQWHKERDLAPDYVCCMFATAPFITGDDLRDSLSLLADSDADYAFSVARFDYPIQRAIEINAAGRVQMLHPEHLNTRSQDLPERYHDAGQFYWGRADAWMAGKSLLTGHAVPVHLPGYRVQDIDTPEDWIHAEALFRILQDKSCD